jgi:hypothetical protein
MQGLKIGMLCAALAWSAVAAQPGVFDVRAHGARGDGAELDTAAIQKAIDAAGKAGGGQVRFPPGRYLSGTIHLRSHVTLFLEAGARLIGTTNLNEYRQPTPPAYMPEARWGKWHRALILGEDVENVTIAGAGIIDGNRVFDPTGEERRRGPHTLVFVGCKQFSIRDVTFIDSANYAIFFQVSDDVDIRNVRFIGGWDGIHWRGAPERWCRNVRIVGCEFYTGDDSIAGRYWDNTVITDCIINSSCNGIRLIGPATRLIVKGCLFYGPGVRPHITSNRTNMLSGIILQPGAWDATRGPLDDVLLADNTMHNVASPVTIWTKPGNTAGRVTVQNLNATGVYRSALSVESWAQEPITNVVFRNVNVEFAGGGKAEQAQQMVKGPGVDARSLPAWGFFGRHAERVVFEDVRFSTTRADQRPVVITENVGQFSYEDFKFPRSEGMAAIVTNRPTATR